MSGPEFFLTSYGILACMDKPFPKTIFFLFLFFFLLCIGCITYQWLSITQLKSNIQTLSDTVASTTNTLLSFSSSTGLQLSKHDQKNLEFSDLLYEQQNRVDELTSDLQSYNKKINRLSGSVETLEKLTTTDPELLQKYSRVYFLNENYKPSDLSVINETYDYVDGKQISIHADVLPFLEDLLESADEDGVNILVLSGYRSFEDQAIIKDGYTIRYGLGANQFSADQGYSEHQLGTTVDFTTQEIGQNLGNFEGTNAYTWLLNNAHKYGFVMSYPQNNEYYIYEPWHWRFVGEDLARDLKKENKYFYDLEQREIDSYLTELFD